MSRKVFHIGIDLDIHAVSCPGVWLCPKGDAMLRISMLGASAHTKRVEPSFPLLFHESFHFRKTFTGITSLAGLQAELTKRQVHLQLVQWQVHGCRCVLLAVFRSSLSELLYPQPTSRGLMAGVDVDLLMETTSCFPGIIAPKVEVSTKVVIEEMVNYPSRDQDCLIVNHKTLSSKRAGNRREDKGDGKRQTRSAVSSGQRLRLRQKPVCHARPCVRCFNCKTRVERPRKVRERAGGECECGVEQPPTKDDTLYIPYCDKCGDAVEGTAVKRGKIIVKESSDNTGRWGTEAVCPCEQPQSSQSVCNCTLCRKYHSLFNNSAPSPPDSALSTNLKSPKWRFERSPSPPKKDKCCPCLDDGTLRDTLRATPDEDYRDLLKADLDSHYRRLYQRVSSRNNRRES